MTRLVADRRIPVERQVRPRLQVVLEVGVEDAPQPALVADDDVIETLPANGADQPLGVRVLLR